MDAYYDEIAEGYESLHREEQLRKVRILKEYLSIGPKDVLLDVGCGTGFYLDQFPCKVMGIDPSKELLARNWYPHQQAKAEDIPFPDDSFDVVISVTALHHVTDAENAILEIKRVGKKQFGLTVLKKAKLHKELEDAIQKHFTVEETIDDLHDTVFICSA